MARIKWLAFHQRRILGLDRFGFRAFRAAGGTRYRRRSYELRRRSRHARRRGRIAQMRERRLW